MIEVLDARVVSIRRYPVKSMMGEELNWAEFTSHGLYGDRAFALVDEETGKVASAKNPKRWPNLFAYRAAFLESPVTGSPMPPVQITVPDGRRGRSDDPEAGTLLSQAIGRSVRIASAVPPQAQLEEYWPDIEGIDHRDAVTDEAMPPGTFFDLAVLHLLTTSTLAKLQELHPEGRIEARRFRPNLVLEVDGGAPTFVENTWHGRQLLLGEVVLEVTGPCPRCVMTTLPQEDLPRDIDVLKTAVRSNQGQVGIYARVIKGGAVTRGARVELAD